VLRALSVTAQGEEYLVGDATQAAFVVLPAIGLVVLRAIEAGSTLAQAAECAREHAGEDVDVVDFAQAMIELGLVESVDGVPLAPAALRLQPTGASMRRLVRLARPLYSLPALILYGCLLAACATVLIAVPRYRPHPAQLFFLGDPVESVAIMVAIVSVTTMLHELAHWLGARVAGVPARITVGRRLYLLVFETNLTALLTLPRRRRYPALLAGMALDTLLLSSVLGLRIALAQGALSLPPVVGRLIAALVVAFVTGLVFQFFVFLRTDLYAVLTTALGCLNLTRVNHLLLKRSLRALNEAESRELRDADPRDLAVARWYRWLYVVGIALAAAYFAGFFVPWIVTIVRWTVGHLARSTPVGLAFWEALGFGLLALAPAVAATAVYARERRQRRRAGSPAAV
jgi:putative peptide zinc metalloprotease protein